MRLIDNIKKVVLKDFAEFYNLVKDDETVIVLYKNSKLDNEPVAQVNKNDLIEKVMTDVTFFDKQHEGKDDNIAFVANDVSYVLTYDWWQWYTTKHRRNHKMLLNALPFYEKKKEKAEVANPVAYNRSLGVLTLENGQVKDFESATITTSVNDVLAKLNEWLDKYFMASSEGKIRFDLNYEKGDEADLSKWKSIEQLVNEGTVVLAK